MKYIVYNRAGDNNTQSNNKLKWHKSAFRPGLRGDNLLD